MKTYYFYLKWFHARVILKYIAIKSKGTIMKKISILLVNIIISSLSIFAQSTEVIFAKDTFFYCDETTVSLDVTVTPNGSCIMNTPKYRWYKNGMFLEQSQSVSTSKKVVAENATYAYVADLGNSAQCFDSAVAVIFKKCDVNTHLEDQSNIQAALTLYPNPVQDILYVNNTGSVSLDRVIIYTMSGQIVKALDKFGTNHRIDLSGLTSGTYLIRIEGEQLLMQQAFIKQ